jgi:hypothetical protein
MHIFLIFDIITNNSKCGVYPPDSCIKKKNKGETQNGKGYLEIKDVPIPEINDNEVLI